MNTRSIVQIDEEKCDGCGLCAPACEEGAIEIVNGKARLVGDILCDGLGACLGHCPRGAISIIEREAAAYDEDAVQRHLAQSPMRRPVKPSDFSVGLPVLEPMPHGGCPGAAARSIRPQHAESAFHDERRVATTDSSAKSPEPASRLASWPLKWRLVPPHAPYLKGADLALAADCVPFAYAGFHERLLCERPVVIGCPKFDDPDAFTQKLAAIIAQGRVRSITVARMIVPCCAGLTRLARAAVALAGGDTPVREAIISLEGELVDAEGNPPRTGATP